MITLVAVFNLPLPSIGAAFQNLDFESANLRVLAPGESGGFVPITNGLPGWDGFLGTSQQTQVRHNNATLGSSALVILGPNTSAGFPIIEGNFTALLEAGVDENNPLSPVDVSIAQAGLIPSDARSIQLKGYFGAGSGSADDFTVTIEGQNIGMTPLATFSSYTLYGGDISPFAGQSGELRITALSNPSGELNAFFLDSIHFSSTPVPEPTTLAMLVLGGAMFAGWLCRRSRRK